MRKLKIVAYTLLGITSLLVASGVGVDYYIKSADPMNKDRIKSSAQFDGESFVNPSEQSAAGISTIPSIIKQSIFDKQQPSKPEKAIPVIQITKDLLDNLSKDETYFFKLGHSSILLWIDGNFWLIDPVFGERASPFSFVGPKRYHQPPIDIASLPNIKGIIFTHNHYDHLDIESIKQLHPKTEAFYMPLGIGADLLKWGVAKEKINEFDWHESIKVGNHSLTATPAQHFSGRGLSDRNKSLWSSWVVKSDKHNLFFNGDSGYFDGFKKIGEKYGPFDISFMENGAYNILWPDVHMMPKETVQALEDLDGGILVPIHNSTFDLSIHTWYEPIEQVLKHAEQKNIKVIIPKMGEAINIDSPPKLDNWWKELI